MFSIGPTPYDLQFTVFRVPVRVHPMFFLFSALLGWNPNDLPATFLFVICAFISVLVHEMGHALTYEFFGARASVFLYHLGGLAFGNYWRRTPWRAIGVSLAGPGAGFLLGGLMLALSVGLAVARQEVPPYIELAITYLIFMNFVWGLLNLLPALPLDGGRVFDAFLEWLRVRRRFEIVQAISVLVAGALAIFLLSRGSVWGGIVFGMIAFQNLAGQFRDDQFRP